MGWFIALFLQIGVGCQTNPSMYTGYAEFDGGVLQIRVESKLFSNKICVELYTPLMMTDGCAVGKPVKLSQKDWIEVPVETGVGSGSVSFQITDMRVYMPLDSLGTIWSADFVLGVYPQDEINSMKVRAQQQMNKEKTIWGKGSFGLVDTDNHIRGAIVFEEERARVFVFDRFWYTPEVQYTNIVPDGGDWLLYFESEPQFFDEVSVLRIHPLQRLATIPRNSLPSSEDIQYTLQPNPPDFEHLQALANAQVKASNAAEVEWLKKESTRILQSLLTKNQCEGWTATNIDVNRLVGYELETFWDKQCSLRVSTELEQHTRRYSGVFSQ